MKRTIIFSLIALVALVSTSCDTGDICPEDTTFESRDITVNLTLSGVETIPNKRSGSSYQYDRKLSLLAYADGDESSTPVVSVLQRSNFTDGTQGSATISYASPSKTLVKLAITLHSNDILYEFGEQWVDASDDDTTITWEATSVDLLAYDRLQAQIYTESCASCHGSSSGSAGLNLSSGYSYNATVNKASVTTWC